MYYREHTIIYFNGAFVKASEARIDLYSQSLHYGYSVFEGIRAYPLADGPRMFKGPEHYDRLRKSAELIKMPFHYSTERLIQLTYEVLRRNDLTNAYIRPIVVSSANMGLTKGKMAFLAIEAWDWTNGYLSNNMRVMTSPYRRPNPDAFHIEAKVSGHYVNSILAHQDARDKGYDEALLLGADGNVAEGPGANVFYEKQGVLYTPPTGNILPGITRATVIEICRELNIPVVEKSFAPDDMRGADAGFFCGTAAEILALESLDDIPFTKQWDGTLSAMIQKAYSFRVNGKVFNRIQERA